MAILAGVAQHSMALDVTSGARAEAAVAGPVPAVDIAVVVVEALVAGTGQDGAVDGRTRDLAVEELVPKLVGGPTAARCSRTKKTAGRLAGMK